MLATRSSSRCPQPTRPTTSSSSPRCPPRWGDEFEVRSQSSQPTRRNEDGAVTSSIQIEAVLFSTGDIPTPELSVAIRKPDGEIINRPVKPIDVAVARFLPEGDDNDLKDIKPQAELPVPLDPLSAPQRPRRTGDTGGFGRRGSCCAGGLSMGSDETLSLSRPQYARGDRARRTG